MGDELPPNITIEQTVDAEIIRLKLSRHPSLWKWSCFIDGGGVFYLGLGLVALGILGLFTFMFGLNGNTVGEALLFSVGSGIIFGIPGALGAIGLIWLPIEQRLKKPYVLCVEVERLAVHILRHRILWSEIDAITLCNRDSDRQALVFTLDQGQDVEVRLEQRKTPSAQAAWLVQRLQERLENFAPGSPANTPDALKDLMGTRDA
jgi:hypothetical protein